MSSRERAMLVLGFIGALLLVLYPLAYRIGSEQAADAARLATPRPTRATPSPRLATSSPAAAASAAPSGDPATQASWHATGIEHQGDNESTFAYECLPGGSLNPIWGTDVYTDDSSICTAAVHAGLITMQTGGEVRIRIRPGLDMYIGSTRNGVRASAFDRWDGSFVFETPDR